MHPSMGSEDGATRGAAFSVVPNGRPGSFELHGELDLATIAVLEELVLDALPDQRVVLDLRGLHFVDSSGLRGLLLLRRRVDEAGGRLVLREPTPSVRRVLEVSGLDKVFSLEA